jgi:uncharacterized membrane protein
MGFLEVRLVHNAAVILFLGNIITALFWAAHARRTRELHSLGVIFDGIVESDRWLSLPAALIVLVSGIAAAGRGGWPILGTGWILWSSISFASSGLVFGLGVAPLQRRIRDLALRAEEAGDGWASVDRLYWKWKALGILSIAARSCRSR